jgi:hypothetical protein
MNRNVDVDLDMDLDCDVDVDLDMDMDMTSTWILTRARTWNRRGHGHGHGHRHVPGHGHRPEHGHHMSEAAIEKTCVVLIHRKMFSECLALFDPSRRNWFRTENMNNQKPTLNFLSCRTAPNSLSLCIVCSPPTPHRVTETGAV